MNVSESEPYIFSNYVERPRISKSTQSSRDNPLNFSNNQYYEKRSYSQLKSDDKFGMRPNRFYNNTHQNIYSYDPLKLASAYTSDKYEYNPWGRPGAGAPMRTTRYGGTLRMNVLNDINRSQFYSTLYPNENRKTQKINFLNELEVRSREKPRLEANGDFISWMNLLHNQHQRSKQNLNHTNVTREKVNSESIRNHPIDFAQNYSNVLAAQSQETERRKKLERIKHLAADEEHIKCYNSWVSCLDHVLICDRFCLT
jgi:hypothetical protein